MGDGQVQLFADGADLCEPWAGTTRPWFHGSESRLNTTMMYLELGACKKQESLFYFTRGFKICVLFVNILVMTIPNDICFFSLVTWNHQSKTVEVGFFLRPGKQMGACLLENMWFQRLFWVFSCSWDIIFGWRWRLPTHIIFSGHRNYFLVLKEGMHWIPVGTFISAQRSKCTIDFSAELE